MVLCITAVGKFYTDNVSKFITKDFSKKFDIHILTDKPELYPNYSTDLYYKSTFNFFDKISYGFTVIDKLQKSGFIIDADDLETFETVYSSFDLSSKYIQVLGYWDERGTLNNNDTKHINFWRFMKNYLKNNNISENNIYMVLEKMFFLPKLNYKHFLKYFESLRFLFEKNSRENEMWKGCVGNGEGVAVGYAFFRSKLLHKKIKIK